MHKMLAVKTINFLEDTLNIKRLGKEVDWCSEKADRIRQRKSTDVASRKKSQ